MTPGADPLAGLDRRTTPFSGRIALDGWRDRVAAMGYVPGEAARICRPVVDLMSGPSGARDRQLLFGQAVTVIERRGPHAFVQAAYDGYCGWVTQDALDDPRAATHRVVVPATHVYREASIKRGEVLALSLGAGVTVLREEGPFCVTPEGFVWAAHLAPVDAPRPDMVAVAESLLGTPYLWGGNSREGIDCSGLVQLSMQLCGLVCPGDSDMQWAMLGTRLHDDQPIRRGDLLFWRGHVAMACDDATLIHANGHAMAVAHEDLHDTLARIDASGEGVFLGVRRL